MTFDGLAQAGDRDRFRFDATAPASVPETTREELRNRASVRSQELVHAVGSIDAQPTDAIASVMQWIQAQYDDRRGGDLSALFGRCYLGHPYVDHVMTTNGVICEHFTPGDDVAGPQARARALAANDAYAYIEIYRDGSVVAVRTDGTVDL
jgi:hypothetical protein